MLYLIPTALQADVDAGLVAPTVLQVLADLRVLAVEDLRTCRRFLKAVLPQSIPDDYTWIEYDKHAGTYPLVQVKNVLVAGQSIGLMSEAGYPAVGDPGTDVVALAHQMGLAVNPLPGSCSFLLALAASGLGGQAWAFHGYLPIPIAERHAKLVALEAAALKMVQVQIFMDTPYRNQTLLADILKVLKPTTRLCIAYDLQGTNQLVRTAAISQWRSGPAPILEKRPAVFLIGR